CDPGVDRPADDRPRPERAEEPVGPMDHRRGRGPPRDGCVRAEASLLRRPRLGPAAMPERHTIVPMTQGIVEDTARHRLRSLRLARGWSLDELAQRSDLSASTISRTETGRRRLALDHLVTLARALDTTVDELLVDD